MRFCVVNFNCVENELINVVVEHPTLIYLKKSILFGSYNHKYQNSYIANFFIFFYIILEATNPSSNIIII